MFISPYEVQEQELKRRLRGYNRASVETLLQNVVSSYEWVWRERDQLKAQVEQLQKELAPLRKAEDQLRDVLVTAERAASEVRAQAAVDADALLEQARAKTKAQENAADEVRAQATRDAEALLEQARAKAKASQSAIKAQQTRLKNEVERLKTLEQELHANLRSFLRSGLELIEDRNETQASPVAEETKPSPVADATQKSPVADPTQKSPVAPLPPSTHKTPDPATA